MVGIGSLCFIDDIKATTQKAKSLGATVMIDVMEVMNMGWLSIITIQPEQFVGFGSRR